jgi:predicted phosphodiesterase
MKISIISDLHTEGSSYRISESNSDLILMAGDICTVKSKNGFVNKSNVPVIAVPGNHEYYGGEMMAAKIRMKQNNSIKYLDCESVIINGVKIIGCTLWPVFNEVLAKDRNYIAHVINDFKQILNDGSPLLIPDMHLLGGMNRKWLREELKVKHSGPIIVMTHFLPSEKSVDPQFKDEKVLNKYFVSDVEDLIGPPVNLWIHGHTHSSVDYTLNGTRVICNPKGYVRRNDVENLKFNPSLTIDI